MRRTRWNGRQRANLCSWCDDETRASDDNAPLSNTKAFVARCRQISLATILPNEQPPTTSLSPIFNHSACRRAYDTICSPFSGINKRGVTSSTGSSARRANIRSSAANPGNKIKRFRLIISTPLNQQKRTLWYYKSSNDIPLDYIVSHPIMINTFKIN